MTKRWTAAVVLFTSTWFTVVPAYAGEPLTDPVPPSTSARAETAAGQSQPTLLPPVLEPAQDLRQDLVPETVAIEYEPDHLSQEYFKGYFSDTGKILNAPLHWDAKDWLKVGLVGSIGASMFLIDTKVKNFTQSHKSKVADGFARIGNDMGLPIYSLPPVGAFYLYGMMKDDAKARKSSLLAFESFAITGLLTTGIKMLVQRHRPNTGDAPGTFDGPKLTHKNLSFLSGHTSSAFALATVFADQYKDVAFVPPLAYGLATLTGLSRIYSNAHWTSDAFFGAALGYFVSRSVLSFHKETPRTNKLKIMPALSKEMTGVTMEYAF